QDRLSLDSASYSLLRKRRGPVSTNGTGTGTRTRTTARNNNNNNNGSTVKTLLHAASPNGTLQQPEISHDDYDGNDDGEDEEEERVDLPMRAFAAGYYDNLRKLYTHLGVTFEEPRFVYSLSTLASNDDDTSTKKRTQIREENYFVHSSNNHILPPIRPRSLSVLRWIVEVSYLLFWYTYFTLACFILTPHTNTNTHPNTSPRRTNLDNACEITAAAAADESERESESETLRSFLSRIHLPTYYTNRYFLPLMSSVTTCTHAELLDFPATDIVTYARRTFRRPHYTVRGGVRQAEGRLSGGLKVRFGAQVTSVRSATLDDDGSGRVKVRWRRTHRSSAPARSGDTTAHVGADLYSSATSASAAEHGKSNYDDEAEEEEGGVYDKVIIAVTPDVVGSIFEPLAKEMREIPTTSVQSVVHQDFARIGLCSAHLWANPRFNSRTNSTTANSHSTSSSGAISAAIHMFTDPHTGRTESIHEHRSSMLITTYPIDEAIDESKILHRAKFTRVLRSTRSREIVNRIFSNTETTHRTGVPDDGWRSGDGNVYLVGGWCWDGMVMLEGCIVSAIRVADALGVEVPWA
ncbi:hypothetical protein BJX64DRAFT_264762, partial [Aspergillus heterothallicus]